MKLMKSKKGKISTQMVNTAILSIVILVVLFKVYAELVPEAQTAGNELNDTYRCETTAGGYWNGTTPGCQVNSTNSTALGYTAIPLGGLFSSSGLVFIVIMASLVVVVVKAFMPGGK